MDTVNYETYETDGVYDSMEQNAPVAKVLLFENKLFDNVTIVMIICMRHASATNIRAS